MAEIEQSSGPRNALERDRLPNKRACETITFERDGSRYQMTIGYYADGRPGEVFLNADRGNSLLDMLASDAAIAISLALQFGCTLETIRHALKRNSSGRSIIADRRRAGSDCAMTEQRTSLAEPFTVAKFWRSRNHSEHVRVDLSEYKGHALLNIRLWQTGTDGIDRPTPRTLRWPSANCRNCCARWEGPKSSPRTSLARRRRPGRARRQRGEHMKKFPKPRKLPKAERWARALRWRVASDRSTPRTSVREHRLRALMGLPSREASP